MTLDLPGNNSCKWTAAQADGEEEHACMFNIALTVTRLYILL